MPTLQTKLGEHNKLNEQHGERIRDAFVRVYRSVRSFERLQYSQHYLDSVENTDMSSALRRCKLKTNDQRKKQGCAERTAGRKTKHGVLNSNQQLLHAARRYKFNKERCDEFSTNSKLHGSNQFQPLRRSSCCYHVVFQNEHKNRLVSRF